MIKYSNYTSDAPKQKTGHFLNHFYGISHYSNCLRGKLLLSMPHTIDYFTGYPGLLSYAIFICAYDAKKGAIGLIVNQVLPIIQFSELLGQLHIPCNRNNSDVSLLYGGPSESGRGFVLHSSEYATSSTVIIDDHFSLSMTLDILYALSCGLGPANFLLTLGCQEWEPGQLESELQNNLWMAIDPQPELIFQPEKNLIWTHGFNSLGIKPESVSCEYGHA